MPSSRCRKTLIDCHTRVAFPQLRVGRARRTICAEVSCQQDFRIRTRVVHVVLVRVLRFVLQEDPPSHPSGNSRGINFVRWILVVTVLVASIGWLGCAYKAAQPRVPVVRSSQWRRTVDGWEQISIRSAISATTNSLGSSTPSRVAHPHPIVVSLLIAMLSALVLVANDCSSVISDSHAIEPAKISEK
jgi:hypothetical protein